MVDGETTGVTVETLPGKRQNSAGGGEGKERKRESGRSKGKTRVNLGWAFTRWLETIS